MQFIKITNVQLCVMLLEYAIHKNFSVSSVVRDELEKCQLNLYIFLCFAKNSPCGKSRKILGRLKFGFKCIWLKFSSLHFFWYFYKYYMRLWIPIGQSFYQKKPPQQPKTKIESDFWQWGPTNVIRVLLIHWKTKIIFLIFYCIPWLSSPFFSFFLFLFLS